MRHAARHGDENDDESAHAHADTEDAADDVDDEVDQSSGADDNWSKDEDDARGDAGLTPMKIKWQQLCYRACDCNLYKAGMRLWRGLNTSV